MIGLGIHNPHPTVNSFTDSRTAEVRPRGMNRRRSDMCWVSQLNDRSSVMGLVLIVGLGLSGSTHLYGQTVAASRAIPVTRLRVPNGGVQPDAQMDSRGNVHLV